MSDEEIGQIRLFEFDKGVEFASNVLNKEIAERDDTIKQLQEENEILRNDLDDALDVKNGNGPTALSRVISENQRLKDALKKVLNHWGKMDNPELCEDDYDNARKLIEP